MKTRNIKLIVLGTIVLSGFFIFYGVMSNISFADFSLYEFYRGMIVGMSSVAAVVWLFFLMSAIFKSGKKTGIFRHIKNNRPVSLSIAMSCFLVGTIVTVSLSDKSTSLIAGSIITFASYVLNFFYLRKIKDQNIACD